MFIHFFNTYYLPRRAQQLLQSCSGLSGKQVFWQLLETQMTLWFHSILAFSTCYSYDYSKQIRCQSGLISLHMRILTDQTAATSMKSPEQRTSCVSHSLSYNLVSTPPSDFVIYMSSNRSDFFSIQYQLRLCAQLYVGVHELASSQLEVKIQLHQRSTIQI